MTSHILDRTRALATPLCGATSGVCVDSDRAKCPDCLAIADCPFCAIASSRVRAAIVDEGDAWTAFPPLGPHVPGHVLFIPRRHVRDATVEPALTGHVMAAASAYLGRVLKSEGNLFTSVGSSATQTVMHMHIHVIPRGDADGLHHDWPWCREENA
jgi:histidine triad (HIT) family protein